jgi:hypothetical protein
MTTDIRNLTQHVCEFEDPALQEYCYTQVYGQYCLAWKIDWQIIGRYPNFADMTDSAYLQLQYTA